MLWRRKTAFIYIILAALVLPLFIQARPMLAADNSKRKVVIVVMDKLSLADLIAGNYPNLKKLMNMGAVGVMNTLTTGDNSSESAYVTIGSGSRLSGTGGGLAFNTDEIYENASAGDVYKRRRGLNPPKEGIVHIGLAPIASANSKLNYDFVPGFLGKALHENNLKTAAFGNADTEDAPKRQIATLVMDDKGLVDYGDVSSRILDRDNNFITGKRTDYDKIIKDFKEIESKADVIAIDLGDTARVESANNFALKNILTNAKTNAIKRADSFLPKLLEQVDLKKDLLIITVPSPTAENLKNDNLLTPIILAGPGIEPGLAESKTTRRPGVVTNTDITATVLHFFHISQPAFINGLPIYSEATTNPLPYLNKQTEQIVANHNLRSGVLAVYRNYVMLIIFIAFISVVIGYSRVNIFNSLLKAALALPPAILLMPLLPETNTILNFVKLIFLVSLIVWLAALLGRKSIAREIAIISLLTALLLNLDVLFNAPLIKSSAMGYDVIGGARYYGIGNEYTGVLIGALIIACAMVTELFPHLKKRLRNIFGLFFIITTYIIAAPSLGTNAGGTIAAVAGFMVTFLLWLGIKYNRKNIAFTIIGIIVVTIIFLGADALVGKANQSHIGRTVTLIQQGGYPEIVNTVVRKELVNLKLIRSSGWTWLYLVNLAVVLFILYRKRYKTLYKKYPAALKAMSGIIVGSVIALIFNDSGIVAAGTMIPYAAVPLLLLAIQERNELV